MNIVILTIAVIAVVSTFGLFTFYMYCIFIFNGFVTGLKDVSKWIERN